MTPRPAPVRLVLAWAVSVLPLWYLILKVHGDPWVALTFAVAAAVGLLNVHLPVAGSALAGVLSAVVTVLLLSIPGQLGDLTLVGCGLASLVLSGLGDRWARRHDPRAVFSGAIAAVPVSIGTLLHLGGWLTVRNLTLLGFGSVVLAHLGLSGRRSPAGPRSSPVALASIAAAVSMAQRTSVATPTLIVGSGLAAAVTLGILESRVAWVTRLVRPTTAPLEAVIGVLERVAAVIDPVLRRVFAALGTAITVGAVSIVWLPTVGFPWIVQRLARWDPLWAPRPDGSRWVPRDPSGLRSEAMWSTDPALRSLAVPLRRRRWLVRVGPPAAALMIYGTAAWLLDGDPVVGRPVTVRASSADEPWYPSYSEAHSRMTDRQIVQEFAGIELPDISSEYVNVRDGWRATWTPPPDKDCDRAITVWMFGGSATFGEEQRDDHTVASELARMAWRDGWRLDVRNGGVHADVAWQQWLRLERALLRTTPAPDLVMFYDGFNDYIVQKFIHEAGMDGGQELVGISDSNLMLLLTELEFISDGSDRYYRAPEPEQKRRDPDNDEIVPNALFQYRAAHRLAGETLAARGIPFARFFQPNLETRTPAVEGDAPSDPVLEDGFAAMRRRLDAEVVDLGDVLDGFDEPVYVDDVHTIEAANPVIAREMYRSLQPTIEAAARRKGVRKCS